MQWIKNDSVMNKILWFAKRLISFFFNMLLVRQE